MTDRTLDIQIGQRWENFDGHVVTIAGKSSGLGHQWRVGSEYRGHYYVNDKGHTEGLRPSGLDLRWRAADAAPLPPPENPETKLDIKIGHVWKTHGGSEVAVIGFTPVEILCWTVQTRNGAKFDLDADGRRRSETRSAWDLKTCIGHISEGTPWPPTPNAPLTIEMYESKAAPLPIPENPQSIPQVEMKASNPKEAVGDTKAPLALLSPTAKLYWAGAQALGMFKYGGWNWRAAGVRTSTYLSAMERHIEGYKSGERLDPADGTHHLGNVMACCGILLDAEAAGKLTDDRPPIVGHRKALEEVEANIADLRKKYADRRPRHWTIADTEEIAKQDDQGL